MADPQGTRSRSAATPKVTGRSLRELIFGKKLIDRINESPSHPFRKLHDALGQKKPAGRDR